MVCVKLQAVSIVSIIAYQQNNICLFLMCLLFACETKKKKKVSNIFFPKE